MDQADGYRGDSTSRPGRFGELRRRDPRLRVGPLLAILVLMIVSSCQGTDPDVDRARAAAEDVLGVVDVTDGDHDTLLYLARIDAVLLASGLGGSAETLTERLDTLWRARYTTSSGRPGWGLPYAWDAFGDGTTNPADTVYTYTTAMAALAFLDGYVALGDSTQLDRAKAAVTTILTECWGYEAGPLMSVWYSNQPRDQINGSYVVHNVNALTLAAIARIDRYEGEAYESEKRSGIEAMLVEHSGYEGVEGQWRYQTGSPNRNDLVHHAYIALGLVEAGLPEAEVALEYMWSEWFDVSTGSFDAESREVMGSTAWGPGDALLPLAAAASWRPQAGLLTQQLLIDVDADGIPVVADRDDNRSVVRYGLGPALYAASVSGADRMFPEPVCDTDC